MKKNIKLAATSATLIALGSLGMTGGYAAYAAAPGAPTITAPASTTLNVGDAFDPMAGVSAMDVDGTTTGDGLGDGDLTGSVQTSNPVDTNIPGTYTVTYDVIDSASLAADQVIQTVTVVALTPTNELPVISAPASTTLNVGDTFDPMAGVSATDVEDGDLTGQVIVTGSVDTSKAGSYTLTYTVTDSAGETSTATQNVTVVATVVDGAPTISAPATVEVAFGGAFDPMAGVSATDVEDGDLTGQITVTGTVDTSTPGKYSITYSVVDSAGNTASSVTTVVVVPEGVEPVTEPTPPSTSPSGTSTPSTSPSGTSTPSTPSTSTPSTSKTSTPKTKLPKTGAGVTPLVPLAGGALSLLAGIKLLFKRK